MTKIQVRHGTAAANPVLAIGEPGYNPSSGEFKVGDGTTAWTALPVFATTADITTAVSNLVDAAPGALDTLNELAAALGDDANFAATVTTALAGKQPLDADLTAIAALASAANKVPYATGSGTWALADLTAFARTLLDDADAAAALVTLGAVSDLDFRLDDTRTPIDGSVTTAKLDATLAAAVAGIVGLGGPYFVTTSAHVLNANNATNTTLKTTAYGVAHYTNAEEPFYGITLSADTSANTVRIGGGVAGGNAATQFEIYTAATSTTTTGTLWTSVDTAGLLDHRGNARVRGGTLTVGTDTGGQQTIKINSAVANFRNVQFTTAGLARWNIRTDDVAESGSDAGSNFQFQSRTDAGSSKATLIDLNRASGAITLGGLLSTLTSATGTAGLRLPHGAAPTSPVDGDMWTTTAGLFVRINGVTKTVTLT